MKDSKFLTKEFTYHSFQKSEIQIQEEKKGYSKKKLDHYKIFLSDETIANIHQLSYKKRYFKILNSLEIKSIPFEYVKIPLKIIKCR